MMMMNFLKERKVNNKRLTVVLGPTAVGKTDYAIDLALKYGCPILSCDSRQIFSEMRIGTAPPSPEQLEKVKHYFIFSHSVLDYYSAGQYELDAMELLSELFQTYDDIIMVGGSGLYADALCYGLDDFPAADQQLRKTLTEQAFGTEFPALQQRLRELDPDSLNFIDISNKQRVIRALEVTLSTGKKYSSFRTAPRKKRFFEIERFALNMPREILYDRINRRVDMMVEQGLVREVQDLIEYRDMPALRTVGYKEIFEYLDGDISLERAIDLIKRDTRRYAKRQVTYFAKERQVEVQL